MLEVVIITCTVLFIARCALALVAEAMIKNNKDINEVNNANTDDNKGEQ